MTVDVEGRLRRALAGRAARVTPERLRPAVPPTALPVRRSVPLFVRRAGLVAALLLLGLFHPRTGAQTLDWKPTRSPELEAANEIDDLEQMIEAQNEIRRRRGKPERTLEDVESEWRGS